MATDFVSLNQKYPFYLGNRPVMGKQFLPVQDKFTHQTLAEISLASKGDIDQAIRDAVEVTPRLQKTTLYERKNILKFCIESFQARKEELARILCLEVGKTIRDSRAEVSRLIDTFTLALEEAGHQKGEILALDTSERGKGYHGFWKRFPIGPCSFISPFNFPLNLTAHKIAPAIAAGCPFILKPASRTPLSSLVLGEILSKSGLLPGSFSILPCTREDADILTTDDRIKLLSFTGSPDVGWDLKNRAGKKKVVLELGGNAACIVDAGVDLEDCIPRLVAGIFAQSGQSCISVQRIFVHSSIYSDLKTRLMEATQKLSVGDPKDEKTDVGPLISEQDAVRLEDWIQKAKKSGATILCGGSRKGALLFPTLLEGTSDEDPISCQEAFGPVAILEPFSDFSIALQKVNQSKFGLQAGIFTPRIQYAMSAWEQLEVGGVVINDVPSWRSDAMPYGGVKDSGFGREGIRFALEEMTEIRALVIRQTVNHTPD